MNENWSCQNGVECEWNEDPKPNRLRLCALAIYFLFRQTKLIKFPNDYYYCYYYMCATLVQCLRFSPDESHAVAFSRSFPIRRRYVLWLHTKCKSNWNGFPLIFHFERGPRFECTACASAVQMCFFSGSTCWLGWSKSDERFTARRGIACAEMDDGEMYENIRRKKQMTASSHNSIN